MWPPRSSLRVVRCPPRGLLRLRPGKAGSADLAGEDVAPTLFTSCNTLPPEGAAAPAARQSRFRGPGW